MRFYWTTICFLCVVWLAQGQDLHHSQFYTSPLNVNPGLTGVFNGDFRAALNYRAQWVVDDLVNYQTIALNTDIKFTPRKMDAEGFWSAGLMFNYDKAGDSDLSLAQLGLTGSYTRALNTNNLVTVGALLGFGQRRFRTDELLWDNQWNGTTVDPRIDPGEQFGDMSNTFLDLGAGMNYRWQKTKRTFVNLGVGVFHINQPDQIFFSQSSEEVLPRRWAFGLNSSIQLTDALDILLQGVYQIQGEHSVFLTGGHVRFHINQQRGQEFALLLGTTHRPGDNWSPTLGLEWRNWHAGFSYDIDHSEFDPATDGRGGPEIAVIYRFTSVKPLPQFKNCPIF